MSQLKQVRNNNKDESSLVFANDESIVQFLLEKILQIDATMIIDYSGGGGRFIKHTFPNHLRAKSILMT